MVSALSSQTEQSLGSLWQPLVTPLEQPDSRTIEWPSLEERRTRGIDKKVRQDEQRDVGLVRFVAGCSTEEMQQAKDPGKLQKSCLRCR
jgi:hypothetical protein